MKLYKQKNGQLKILESVAVLIVFFFLVGMGISFYAKIQIQALDEAKAEFKSLDATKISQKIIHLPELRCSLQNADQGSCVDFYQALAWQAVLTDDGCFGVLDDRTLCSERLSHYFEQIGVGEVVLNRVYSANPARIIGQDIVLYNYTTTDVRGSKFTQIPVIIHDSVTQTNDLGMLRVRVYE